MDQDIKNPPDTDAPSEPVNELELCQQKCDEYLNNWKRATADLANYKKEEMERLSMLGNYAKEDVLEKVLPILDNFYLAESHVPDEIKNNGWMAGFLQIKSQISEFLKQAGIEEVKTVGQMFDPTTMEALGEIEAEGKEHGEVIEELQKGYKVGERVLRPARVKISK